MVTIWDFQSELFLFFAIFFIYKVPQYSLLSFESIYLSVQGKKCQIKVIAILPIKFQVKWPLELAEEIQNRFSKW